VKADFSEEGEGGHSGEMEQICPTCYFGNGVLRALEEIAGRAASGKNGGQKNGCALHESMVNHFN